MNGLDDVAKAVNSRFDKWNYRIVRHPDGLKVHEVWYDEDENVIACAEAEPFVGEDIAELVGAIKDEIEVYKMMLRDVENGSILDEKNFPGAVKFTRNDNRR